MADMLRLVIARPSGAQEPASMPVPPAGGVHGPLVSCLMVTRGDRATVAQAIDCYRRQSYANRELVIVCDRPDNLVAPLLAERGDPSIRLHIVPPDRLGTLRNVAASRAEGALLAQWDDDDLAHPQRLDIAVAALAGRDEIAASFLLRWTLWWPARDRLAISSSRLWEGSILIRREALGDYPPLGRGEDFAMVQMLRGRHPVIAVDAPGAYLYVAHGGNTCDAPHFERLFANASVAVSDYPAHLAELAAVLPVAPYMRSLGLDEDAGASRHNGVPPARE